MRSLSEPLFAELVPARGLLRVRPVDVADTFAGGRILVPADTRERLTMNQCEVIAVGAFAVCDDEDCERPHELGNCIGCPANPATDTTNMLECCGLRVHAHPVRVGDWLLVAPRSYIDGPEPERKEWFVHQDAVLGIFNSTETTT